MLNDDRRDAENPARSDKNDRILNFKSRKTPMPNTATETPQQADNQTKEKRIEEDSVKQEYCPGLIHNHDVWQIDTIEDLQKSMRSETRLLAPRTRAIMRSEPQQAIRLIRHHTESALAQLLHFGNFMFEWGSGKLPYHQMREITELQQDFPKYMRSRLDPVFSRPGIFDPEGRYELGFARWEREFIFCLEDSVYRICPEDYASGDCENCTMRFDELFHTLNRAIHNMRDELESKYGAALH